MSTIYDYQYGYCHYFANLIINKIREYVPKNVPINYYLILAERYDDNENVIDHVLVHAYIKIKEYYLDSEGFHTKDDADIREMEWSNREEQLTPDDYSYDTWQEETDSIPEHFFNRFCKASQVKKDIKDFISQPNIQEFFTKLKEESSRMGNV
jgi:hypothetical protein